MSKFNKVVEPRTIPSYEGGMAYEKNCIEDLTNFMFSSYLENQFYETADEQINRFIDLLDKVSKQVSLEWIAKLSFFARKELGMKSVSHLTAAWLNSKTFENKRAYYRNTMKIPSDIAEVFAAIDMLGDKRSHALVRGAGDYLSSLKDYQLGKYKLKGKEYNMYDLINITHAHSATIDKYKAGTLETPDTWETAISGSKSEEEKSQNWQRLVEENKLGYLALIRNLRNIVNSSPDVDWIEKYLVPQIENEVAIKKSLVFPYQIYCSWKNYGIRNISIDAALDRAFRIACGNMPKMDGRTVIVLDVSGSMENKLSSNSSLTLKEVGAVYAAAMFVNCNADFIKFGNDAKRIKLNKLDSIFNLVEKMYANDDCGYGTDIVPAFRLMNEKYDRIFLVSDMQIMSKNSPGWWWCRRQSGIDTYNRYCEVYKCHPHMYSFDLANYSTQVENPNNPRIHLLTALNDTLFKMLPYIENGNSLVDYINNNFSYC
jgi:hypothetical protein